MATPAKSNVIAFGAYEFNVVTRELRKNGMRMRLEGQPLTILEMLLERPGELVTREELRNKLWPDETFVDFEHSLNAGVKRLRAALSDSAEHPRYIETQARRGYRFIAPVDRLGAFAAALANDPPAAVDTARARLTARGWSLLATIALCIVGFLGWSWHRWLNRSTASPVPVIHSLAVLPLKNLSGDPAQEYLSDGMTEELIGRLSMIRGLRVISRTSAMQFKDTRLSAPEIASRLGVDALVEGSVIREGNRIRVHAQLIRASSDEHFWSETYDRELGDALTLESEIAQSIARRVEVTVTGRERARLIAARPVSPEVYEHYLKGLSAKNNTRAEVKQRIAYFDEAIRRDPTFAPAYVGLAIAYDELGTNFVGSPPAETRPRVISNARKALELDPELSDAHSVLATTYLSQWHWAEAEAEVRRALDLNPNDAAANAGLSDLLLCKGRTDEALEWARRAREIDPLGYSIAWTLFNARRYEEAIHEIRNELAVKPDRGLTLWRLGWVLICDHHVEEAITVLEKAASVTERSPGVIGTLAWAYAHPGRRSDALQLVEELKRREKTGYVPPAAFMNAYFGLGENDQAFAWVERAYQEQSNGLKYIKVFPPYDSVRGDPRFADLLRRVGLS